MSDTVDKLVLFLAKRDGIDKLVKTFQYVSKLLHWRLHFTHPSVANRAKNWETASGLSRKAFRSGRFLTGFNALRRTPPRPQISHQILSVTGNGGEMVYFMFDHFLWLSRVGVLEASLAKRMSFVSAFGEAVGYVCFVLLDLMALRREVEREKVVMRLMGMAANVADLVIAVAEVEPNPVCNHTVTLGISGLVSAWAGWYRNWPS